MQVVTFLLTLTGIIVSAAVDFIFISSSPPLSYMIWPPFAFYRCMAVLNSAAVGGKAQGQFGGNGDGSNPIPYKLGFLKPGNEVFNGILMMCGCSVFYLLFAAYLYQVLPSKYGIHKKWYFPIVWVRNVFIRKTHNENSIPSAMPHGNTQGDPDVQEERQKIYSGEFPLNSPLIIKNLHKSFDKKIALNGISLTVEKGIVFGLLGENGAGKTTLISILSGLFSADYGKAILTGYDTLTQMKFIHQRIGICPQYDIHWEDLTIEEHLLFYVRLKDISKKNEDKCVSRALDDVGLTGMGHRQAKALSGGEKRRLSIAMALIGDPIFVFLDEPTTGLDPQVRRIIWNIIQESRRKQTFLLTTHSMEEAEILCQRIGIMSHGKLECIGSPLHLKNIYGSGFNLTIKYSDKERAFGFLETVLQLHCESWIFAANFDTGVMIELTPKSKSSVGDLCEDIQNLKDGHGIEHWGISQKSMEVRIKF